MAEPDEAVKKKKEEEEEKEKKKKESELEKTTEKEHEKLPEEQKKRVAEKQKEEPKKPTLLDKVFDFGYHAAMAVGTTALGLATAGTAAPIVAGAFAGGGLIGSFFSKKENKPSLYERVLSSLRVYSVVNAILHPMVLLGNATYPLINNATLLGKAARALYGVTLYNMTFLTSFKAGDHLVKNKFDFKGIGKSVKDNWVQMYKRFAIGFSPAYALTANGITSIAGYPTFAYNALLIGMYNGINPPGPKKKEEVKQQTSPQTYPQGYQRSPA